MLVDNNLSYLEDILAASTPIEDQAMLQDKWIEWRGPSGEKFTIVEFEFERDQDFYYNFRKSAEALLKMARKLDACVAAAQLNDMELVRTLLLKEVYIDGTGQEIFVHSVNICQGGPCPIHNPSNHHMRDWPTHWRNDKGIMERICPHGVGHPDPDDRGNPCLTIHGCDGCCQRGE